MRIQPVESKHLHFVVWACVHPPSCPDTMYTHARTHTHTRTHSHTHTHTQVLAFHLICKRLKTFGKVSHLLSVGHEGVVTRSTLSPHCVADYRYRQDEIFKRMKVTTFAQLVLQVAFSEEYMASPETCKGDCLHHRPFICTMH